jgi:hypothetical protein
MCQFLVTEGLFQMNSVPIVFDEQQSTITATLNDKSPLKFPLDEDECFITYQKDEVSVDRLSELALYEAFFKAPAATHAPHYLPQSSRSPWE